jgi:lipoprotein-releasing system permease protein
MKYTFKIALRYIFTLRSYHFISIISLLSALGITIGVSALIIVTSLFNGFQEFAENEIIGFEPHIRIFASKQTQDYSEIKNYLSQISNLSYYPYSTFRGIIFRNNNYRVVQFYCIEDSLFQRHPINSKIIFSIEKKKYDLGSPIFSSVYIGAGLADAMKLIPGEQVSFFSIKDVEASARIFQLPIPKKIILTSIFQTNNVEYDNNYVFLPYSSLKYFWNESSINISGIDIRLADVKEIDKLAKSLRMKFPDYNILTWYDLNKDIMNAMEFERYGVFLVLSLIISIAVFNILASLVMTVLEKRSDIAVLLTIGSTPKDISWIFRLQGIIVGSLSTFAGLILGLALTLGQIKFQWLKLNTQKYVVSALPMKISIPVVIAIVIVSLLLSYLSTIYPSKKASEILVSEAIFRE